jgi:hypothetical protein
MSGGFTTYTFAGITFKRVVGDDYEPWVWGDIQYSRDVVLGGTKAYIDIGATVYPPLTFRASCGSTADRAALYAAVGTTGTLTSSRGLSGTFTLVKARPVNGTPHTAYYLDTVWEYLP